MKIFELQETTQHQLHSQPSQTHQTQQVNATYWKSPSVSSIDNKSIGVTVVDAKSAGGIAANFTNQSFPLIHNTQSSFSNVVPPTASQQVSSKSVTLFISSPYATIQTCIVHETRTMFYSIVFPQNLFASSSAASSYSWICYTKCSHSDSRSTSDIKSVGAAANYIA